MNSKQKYNMFFIFFFFCEEFSLYTNPSLLVSTIPLNSRKESKSLDGSFNMPI